MKLKIFVLYACFYMCCSCKGHKGTTQSTKDTAAINNGKAIYTDTLEAFFQSKGVLVFKATDENLRKDAQILNQDNTLFAIYNLAKNQITVGGSQQALSDFSNENKVRIQNDFFPKEFYPELSVVQFEYTGIVNGFAEIILDKKKQVKKRIRLQDSLYAIEPWRGHIPGTMVDFNPQNNPIRTAASDNSAIVSYENIDDVIFVISNISGDWMQITCAERCGFECPAGKKITGWIKWKKGAELLIRLNYAC